MTISSLGAGSGMDLSGILKALMQVEQQPLLALQRKEASYQSRISALGTLKGALSSLQTAAQSFIPSAGQTAANKYASFKASIADSTIASASAGTGAVSGTYSLEVSALAQTQRLTTPSSTNPDGAAALASALSAGGELKIQLGSLSNAYEYTSDAARELNITVAPDSTLEQVRDAINTAAADGRVSATIINGTNGKQLVLTSAQSGLNNVIKLSGVPGLDFDPADSASGSGTLSQAAADGGQAASNAAFTLNGIAGTSSTNSVSGVLDGVTLSLLKTNVGSPTTLTVTKDSTSALTTSINAFVKAFNETAKSIKELGFYNAETKKSGALQGNSTLRGSESQIRNLLATKAGGSSVYQTLSDIGISLEKDGTIKLDSSKLNKAVTNDFAGVANLVSVVGSAFKTGIDGLVGTTGNIAAATDSATRTIKDIGKREEALIGRLTQIETRYRKQFTSLDSLISSMNKTSNYLTQQLANLPGAAR